MQNYCKTIGALAAASALVAGNASAEVEYELHTGYTTNYLFRGFNLGQDLVEVGVDAATEWNGWGLSAGAWLGDYKTRYASGDISRQGGDFSTNELDLYAEVSRDVGFATLAVGYIWYINDNFGSFSTQDYQEVYFTASHDFGYFNASAAYYWGIEGANGGYSDLAISRTFELNPCWNLNLSTDVSYFFDYSEWGSWTSTASLDWGFTETAKLSPFITVSVAMADVLSDELVGGGMLSVSF